MTELAEGEALTISMIFTRTQSRSRPIDELRLFRCICVVAYLPIEQVPEQINNERGHVWLYDGAKSLHILTSTSGTIETVLSRLNSCFGESRAAKLA